MSWIIAVALLGILAALATAGLFMLRRGHDDDRKDGQADKRMARALAVRVALSVALFLFIMLAYWMGWISPTGVPIGR
jgi:purine-cytosine permease-like protein